MDDHSQSNKIFTLQVYRGIAAIFVLLFHLTYVYKEKANVVLFGNVFSFGYTGVDFFFVLSGFIILYANWSIIGKPDKLKSYLQKRFTRIYPIYWVITSIKICTIFILPSVAKIYEKDLGVIIKSYLLIPQENLPIIGAAWSLSYEILFYVLFCIFIVWGVKNGFGFMVLWGIAILTIFISELLGIVSIQDNLWLKFIFNERNLEFLLGCLSAYIVIRFIPRFKYILVILGLVLCIISIVYVNHGGVVSSYTLRFGLPSFLLVTGSVFIELGKKIKWPKILVFLGDASYSIYLTHAMFINIFAIIFGWLLPDKYLYYPITAIFISVFSIFGGSTTYILIEKPILSFLRKRRLNWLPPRQHPDMNRGG